MLRLFVVFQVNNNSKRFFLTFMNKPEALQTKEINLVVISALCSMRQSLVSLKRATFANFKTSHEISYIWKNYLAFDLLAKKRNLQIGQLMRFW